MKNASIFSTVLLLLSALFISQTAQAQWSQNTTSIYPTTLTKKVGIGLSDPSYPLEVKGNIGLRNSANGFLGSLSDDGAGNLSIVSYNSPVIGSVPKHILLNPAPIYGKPGNVGIGSTSPTEAKLVVQGAAGNTVALFRKTATSKGLSIVTDWPGIYFNCYYNGGSKSMAPGYTGIVNFDPDFGRIDFGVTGTASTAANAAVDLTTRMCINKDGNIGIGTGAPVSRLDVMGQDGLRITGYQPFYTLLDNNSNRSNRMQSANGDFILYRGVGTAGYVAQMIVKDNGNVLIGTVNDNGFKLAVNGNIRAKEIRVQTGWADYVFADDYQLRPLEEVETFIKANKHLPDIQPAKEIQENGLDVAATTTKMMAKIEELTLYLIDLKKENDVLKTRIEKLEKH